MRDEFAYIVAEKMDDKCFNRVEMNKFLQAWRKEQINKKNIKLFFLFIPKSINHQKKFSYH